MSTDLATVLPQLRAPFAPAAVHFKIQTNPKNPQGSALIVAYIDARLVAERLNYVCPADWSATYKEPMGKAIVCSLQVFDSVREDVGFGDGSVPDMAVKSMYSDAFKRAAVKYGVGAFLYALPKMFVKAHDLKNMGNSWYMTPGAENQLRHNYARWLARKEVADRFGKYIDHGDELADSPEPPPQNFPQTGPKPNEAAFKAIASEHSMRREQLNGFLDSAQAPAAETVQQRLEAATVEQIDAAIEAMKFVAEQQRLDAQGAGDRA